MKAWFSKNWANPIVPALVVLALVACGGKKGGGEATNAEAQANIEKVSTAGGGSGLDVKDSGTGNDKDICDRQGDAYARFANYTYNSRDYVFKAANDLGFHSLYQANPAQYTAKDIALMHTYFVQADKRVYGILNAEIEKNMVTYQQAAQAGEWAKVQARYNNMQTMLQARKTLFAFYANIFGMSGGITWYEGKDLDGEIAAAMKPYRDSVTASTSLTAVQKAEIEYTMVESAKFTVSRVAEKDYVVATTFNASRKMLEVQLLPVTAETMLYANHQKLQKADYAVVEEMMKANEVAYKDIETQYTILKEKQATMDAVEYQNQVTALREQYVAVTADKYLMATFFRPEFSRASLVERESFNTAPSASSQLEAVEKKIADVKAKLANASTDAERAALQTELDSLNKEYERLRSEAAKEQSAPAPAAPTSNGANTKDSFNFNAAPSDSIRFTNTDGSKD